ncbi:MAG: penicillin-binding transpeptidase domain-containing protein [Oscillospiraceae bacterium]|nr:penicillin-binding transpeptidase domain-containing protein [Oscillospiraceae bacterium]
MKKGKKIQKWTWQKGEDQMGENRFALKSARIFIMGALIVAATTIILVRLFDLQVTNFKYYQERSISQREAYIPINPERGVIYDRNMKVLADNTQVERVVISPYDIKSEEAERLIAQGLSELLEVDYEEIYEKTQKKNRKYELIKSGVEADLAAKVLQFIAENSIDPNAIYLEPETKRVYPYANLAAQLIGFTGAENEGQFGIEYQYNGYLKGAPGRIITVKNAMGKSVNPELETYVDVQNGNNIILTIDLTIQSILEKNLEEAFNESLPRERAVGIVMDVNTGEILAMATKPDFDPNDPYNYDPDILEYINLNEKTLAEIESQEYESEEEKERATNIQKLYKLWNNKAVSETYEPGSTFKVITAAMAFEEKAVSPTDIFVCSGSYTVSGIPIACHYAAGHGRETFAYGLQQSCNPCLMQTAERIGNADFLKYLDAFGYNTRTGIDLPFESLSAMHAPQNFRSVELATASFGQRFEITPIQQLVGLAAVANGGKLVVPHVVKSIMDDSGNVVKNFEPEITHMVLSEETCNTLTSILAEGVANGGAAKNAYVTGYDVAAKTGTSEKGVNTGKYIGSCMAYAPADDPKIIVLIIVDEPTGGVAYGSQIAAPYISKTLSEVLPYMGIEPSYEELIESYVNVKNYKGQDAAQAKEDIIAKGLRCTVVGEGDTVKDQLPKTGSVIPKNGVVVLYTENAGEEELVPVPDANGLNAKQADDKMAAAGLNINIIGAEDINSLATARSQKPAAGELVLPGTIVEVEFRHDTVTD